MVETCQRWHMSTIFDISQARWYKPGVVDLSQPLTYVNQTLTNANLFDLSQLLSAYVTIDLFQPD